MQTLSMRRYRLSHPNLRRVRCSQNLASDRLPITSTRAAWPIPEPRRFRDKDHVKFVAKQPCLDLRTTAIGCASSALRPAPRTRPQGER